MFTGDIMVRNIRNATQTLAGGQSNVLSESKIGGGRRVVLSIDNMEAVGGNDVFISIDSEAKANTGRRIQPGQTCIWSTDGGYIPPQQRVNAYSAGNVILAIYEEIEV